MNEPEKSTRIIQYLTSLKSCFNMKMFITHDGRSGVRRSACTPWPRAEESGVHNPEEEPR